MLELAGLTVERGAFALRDVSLRVGPGRTLAVLGPNGSGKSTLLEAVAGLLPARAGSVAIGGEDRTRVAPERRRVGYLVQDYGLFPHLTVRDNVRFGMPAPLRRARYDDELLARLRIGELASRRPGGLSGGERQRVALARALATEAQTLLFDEPFAALDVTLRPAIRADLRVLLRELGVPAVFVTHDRLEARELADEVAVLRDGRVLQTGSVAEVFDAPADPFVAEFVGIENRWPARVAAVDGATATLALDDAALRLAAPARGLTAGARVLACVRAEDLRIELGGEGLAVRALGIAELGPFATLTLDCGIPVIAYVAKREATALARVPPERLRAVVPPAALHLVPLYI